MKRLWTILIITVISTIGMPLAGQKIERESSDRSQIIHLKTALNHLTVIELREPVTQVATGSQSFKVEWRVDLASEHRLCETGGVRIDRRDDLVGGLFALVVPAAAGPEIVAEMLAEQRSDMPALGRERRVQRRRDQHLDDRLF